MNKIFKFMPVALGMLALASCSQDDFEGNDVVQLKSNQILATVEVAYDENGNPTRNGMGEFGSGSDYQFVWQTGDEAKLYAARNWKTDVWTVVETADKHTKGVFESTNRVAVTDMAYGLYPADGTLVNEDRSELSVELPSLIVYDKLFDATYGEQTANAYACQRPLFGFAVDQDLKFRYLTSVLRLKIQNGLPAGAKYVVVRSSETADKLSGTFTADIKQISEEFFEDNTKGATYEIPTLVGDATTAANWVCVDLTKATNYDNNIYIPIPAQVYTGELSVYLCNSSFNPVTYDGSAAPGNGVAATFYLNGKEASTAAEVAANTPLRTYDVAKEFSRTTVYTIGTIVGPATLSCDAKTFIDVNEYLATLKPDRDLTINFTNQVNSFVKTVWGVKLESNTLEIPASWNDTEHTVTLQFAGGTQSINTSGTVNLEGVTLSGTDLKTLEISNKGTMKNVIINADNAGEDITVDVKESAGQITLGDNIKKITLTSGNVAIGKDKGTNTGVEITDNGATSLTINSGTIASLTPKSSAVTIKGGTVNALQLTDRNFAITMTGGKIGTIKKPTALSTVERTVNVATEGAAEITTVEEQANLKYVFTAKYTDATHGTSATAQEKIYTAAQFVKATEDNTNHKYSLYTDIEIANKTAAKNITPLNLNAAIKTFDGQGHKISNLYAPLFDALASTAEGGLTIQNLVIENPTIATAKNVGTVTASVTKTATLKNIAVTGAKIGADYGTVEANSTAATVGGLVGSFAGSGQTLTITDCSVAGTVQGYYNVGGFIGLVNEGTVNITKTADVVTAGTYMSNVTLKKNYWKSDANDSNCGKVGNFIGSITAAAALTIGDAGGTGNAGANAFNKFFSANSVNATTIAIAEQADANKGYLEFARNISEAKKYQGSENQLVGYSTAAPKTTTIFGQTKAKAGKLDATGETITLANYFNYSK